MSLLQMRQRDVTPPGGWSYRTDDNTVIEGGDFGDLVINVMKFRADRGQPTHNLAEEIEDAICRQKDVRCRPRVAVVTAEGTRPVTVADVWRFLKTLLAWVAKDRTFVPQEEAERRAEICSSCPAQTTPVGCWGCSGAFALILAVIADRRTKLDDNLRSCSVCGCENRSQIHIPLPTLQKISGNLAYPEWCWKRSEQ